jgi:Sap, sulfolipid-1-addressing protein
VVGLALVLIEVILLGLATTVRPTSLAAVYALLSTAAPRRLMTLYVLAGLAFTIAFGLLVVWAFKGIDLGSGSSHAKAVAQIVGGFVVLVFAACVLTGRVGGPWGNDGPRPPSRWAARLERHLTPGTATLAGPATHIPGVFYLVALNVIVAQHLRPAGALAGVLVYNAIWFAIPIGALAVCIVAPETARDGVHAIEQWTRRNARMIVLILSFAIGAGLVVRGALAL